MSLFISLDLETLGLNRWAPIIEIGAVVADWMTGDMLAKFHTYVTHGSYDNCEPFAMSMHSTILRRIALGDKDYQYTPIHELTDRFAEWVSRHPEFTARKINFSGKNLATFDLPMLETQCLGWREWYQANAHHRVLDPGNLFWNPIEDDCLPNSDTCRERAHIKRLEEEKHNALEDAEDVAKMIFVAVGRRMSPIRLYNELYHK